MYVLPLVSILPILASALSRTRWESEGKGGKGKIFGRKRFQHFVWLHLSISVFCVIVFWRWMYFVWLWGEDGGATQPNKWWQLRPKGIYRMCTALDKIWTNKQTNKYYNTPNINKQTNTEHYTKYEQTNQKIIKLRHGITEYCSDHNFLFSPSWYWTPTPHPPTPPQPTTTTTIIITTTPLSPITSEQPTPI